MQLLQQMVDNLPLLVIQLDTGPRLRCALASGALLELVTPHGADAVGRDALDLFGPTLHGELLALLQQSAQEPAVPFTWRVVDAQGNRRVLDGHLRTLTDDTGRASGHFIDALDTTAYHETMGELQFTESRLQRFVMASSDGIVVHVNQQIINANPAACRLLASTPSAVYQQHFASLIAPEYHATYEMLMKQASHEAFECELINTQGARIAVELIGRTVQRHGSFMRMAIVRDVRDRRDAQARIRALIDNLRMQKDRAESADRAKSLFLSAASHDLRQPIHALGLLLSSLEALTESPRVSTQTLEELTRRMAASLDALSRLLNSLLDISRLDANAVVVHAAPVSLAAMFNELADDLADAAQSKRLRLDVVPTDAWVQTDAVVLRRILDNLVSNALRYTRAGRVLVVARSRGTEVEVQVWDTGIGIASDQLDGIFKEFYQVHPHAPSSGGLRGLGLGLSIVQRSARLLNARLQVRSTPGKGSMFSITLPRAEAVATPPSAHTPIIRDSAPKDTPRRVLVIDDDAMVLMAMQQLLQAWGHEVWCASDADQAIVLAISHAEDIDLVLSDYHLGDGIHATQFIDAVRACLARPVPVHVFTADTSLHAAQAIRSLGLSLLHKPVRQDDLRRVLQQVDP
ncbi:MAG: PAS domain S-box protein [Hydrogenophaga sp.]|uniref:hybrid sensor histidine kinase/response regulator n=1 Tax=Hydrogenophaga sp. TaxID=1904254 RepID=UPI001E0B0625|nr:ATP-binding protein [Hydrogenophaga sp.]MBX3611805.1 PAS domain S-box protein [Hydrogenophaga sp.]